MARVNASSQKYEFQILTISDRRAIPYITLGRPASWEFQLAGWPSVMRRLRKNTPRVVTTSIVLGTYLVERLVYSFTSQLSRSTSSIILSAPTQWKITHTPNLPFKL